MYEQNLKTKDCNVIVGNCDHNFKNPWNVLAAKSLASNHSLQKLIVEVLVLWVET